MTTAYRYTRVSCLLAVLVACSSKTPSTGGEAGTGTFHYSSGSGGYYAGVGAAATGGSGGTGVAGTAGTGAGSDAEVDAGPPPLKCTLTVLGLITTELDVGVNVVSNETDATLSPIVLAALPKVGARVAFMSDDGKVHAVALDENDHVYGPAGGVSFPAHDLLDMYADDGGGVILITRDAQGGGSMNCGDAANLCTPPDPAAACFDMYLMRFNANQEAWATQLTTSSAALPPYSTGKTGADVSMIWSSFAHHGRIGFNGYTYAGYFGAATSKSEAGCINVHQGDRLQFVDKSTGSAKAGGFDVGCSSSSYPRIVWDAKASKFVTVCKTDNQNRIASSPDNTTIYPVDLAYSDLGNLVAAADGGYWLVASNAKAGQPPGAAGLAEVHLLHFKTGMAPDLDIVMPADPSLNVRAPHLAAYGTDHLLVGWETSTKPGELTADDTERKLYIQSRLASTGLPDGEPLPLVGAHGNRFQDFVAFADGSAALATPGDAPTTIKIYHVPPCAKPM